MLMVLRSQEIVHLTYRQPASTQSLRLLRIDGRNSFYNMHTASIKCYWPVTRLDDVDIYLHIRMD